MPLMPGAQPFDAEGDDLGVLLLHSMTGTPAGVTAWAEHIAAAGHTVAAPRLPGHGTRWQDLNLTTWHDWYAEAERSLAVLTRRCRCVVVMGLSLGGTLGLRLAEVQPAAVRGLVLVNASVHSERRALRLLPLASRVVGSVPGITDIKREGVDGGGYDRVPLKALLSATRLWGAVKKDIHRVDQPVLLFRSADDHTVEPSNAAWILANIRSPQAAEVVLEDSYHLATLDHDAPEIFERSLDFAEQVCR